MSSEPPGSGAQPPDDDPFRKQPPPGAPGTPGAGSGSPYDSPQPPPYGQQPPPQGQQPPPYGQQPPPYGQPPYSGGAPHGGDPLAGMPPLADSGKRTLARIIDLILVGIVVWLVTWPIHAYTVTGDKVEYGKSFAQSLVAAVLYIGYDTVMISKSGQTLGKKWLNMRVANLDNGATPSVQSNLARAAVLWIPFAFCCACIWTAISGGWSYFDRPYKQGLHDKAAKTVVVSTN